MKAYSLHSVGDLRYENILHPTCPPGWCIVQVKAVGICSSDIPRIYRKGTYHFPTVPGHEFSGVVVEVAEDENHELIGKHVSVFPLIPCRKCEQCKEQRYEMCTDYDYIGSRRDGAFAEFVAVPVWNLVELPDTVSFVEAAMMEPLAVAKHAINLCDILQEDAVAIIGSGMIAFAAAQWASVMGASRVCVIGRSESKRKYAERLPNVQYVTGLKTGETFDVVLEAVGSNPAIVQSIAIAKPSGRIVLMGNPEGDIKFEQNQYWQILRKQLRITGTWNSSYLKSANSDWSEVKNALINKTIQATGLVSHLYPYSKLPDALKLMREKSEPYTKVVVLWGDNNE